MSRTQKTRSRAVTAAVALAATMAGAAVLASPAAAASASGEAILRPADHSKGRTLSGQGVKIVAGAGAGAAGGMVTLPVGSLDPNAVATAASLSFERGKRAVALTGISFDLAKGTLNGSLGGRKLAVFHLGAAAAVDAGSVSLQRGQLRLTNAAAAALKRELGLERALLRRGVGQVWLSARVATSNAPVPAAPTPVIPTAPRPVVSGQVDWGVLASWRKYVLGNFGPGSVGTITTEGGATANGSLSEPGAFFSLPASGGGFDQAAGQLDLTTAGSVIFAKPGHCIIEVRFSGIEVDLAGAASTLTLDAVSDVDKVGAGCEDQPPVVSADVPFASLDLSSVTPSYSADGKTVTWTAVPATLTTAGAAAWNVTYTAGQALDPVTITVNLG